MEAVQFIARGCATAEDGVVTSRESPISGRRARVERVAIVLTKTPAIRKVRTAHCVPATGRRWVEAIV